MPLDEIETAPDTRKVSVTFERKKDLGSYQNVVARAWIEDTLPADVTPQEAAKAASDLLNVVKAVVLDHLGIEVLVDEQGIIREQHEPVVTVEQAVANVSRNFPGTSGAGNGIRIMNSQEFPDLVVPADIAEVCHENGITAVWAKDGQYGVFYKEHVPKGGTPKLPDQRDPSKAAIIKAKR